jgi:hypothetical protein
VDLDEAIVEQYLGAYGRVIVPPTKERAWPTGLRQRGGWPIGDSGNPFRPWK